ncbi:hypothetical protein LJB42_003610 [Komagataella kurtzmanii]|nr:hypothetical protein LJB42_003610 [Komagataella kurtzmanii]
MLIHSNEVSKESLLLHSLSSDDYIENIGPIIRTAIKNNGLDNLIETLQETVCDKEQQLQEVSVKGSSDIKLAVGSIIEVKKISDDLRYKVLEINDDLESTGKVLNEKNKVSIKYKKLYNKINETIFVLKSCLQILELTNKIIDLIGKKSFYHALKNLQDLVNIHLNEIETFEFTKKIISSVPTLHKMIKEDCFSFVKKWLGNLERHFHTIGDDCFQQLQALNSYWAETRSQNPILAQYSINSPIELSVRPDKFKTFDPFSLNNITLDSVYDSMMVYDTINELDELKEQFKKEWLIKKDRLVYPMYNSNPSQEMFLDRNQLRDFIYSLIGLLVCDRLIGVKTHFKLRSSNESREMFVTICKRLVPILKKHVDEKITTLDDIIFFKKLICCSIQILEQCDYPIENLYSILLCILQRYMKIITNSFKIELVKNMNADDSMPLVVKDMESYKSISIISWYRHTPSNNRFPKQLPFSSIYPMTCLQIQNLIKEVNEFIDDFYSYQGREILQITIETIDSVLNNIVIKNLRHKIESTIKEVIAQNLINLEFFSTSVREIENLLSYSSESRSIDSIHLTAYDNFLATRKLAEDKLFEMVDTKVEDLLDFVDYNWRTKEQNPEPNIFIKDIGQFLQMMFTSTFSNLPRTVKSLLLLRTFDLLSSYFLDFLKRSSLFTKEAIYNFDMDITYIESIINELNGQNQNQPADEDEEKSIEEHSIPTSVSLQSTFIELRQLINLLKSGTLDEFREQSIRMRTYDRIKPEDAISAIHKLEREPEIGEEANELQQDSAIASISGSGRFARFGYKFKKSTAG